MDWLSVVLGAEVMGAFIIGIEDGIGIPFFLLGGGVFCTLLAMFGRHVARERAPHMKGAKHESTLS